MSRTIFGSLFSYLRKLATKRSHAFTCCAGCKDLPVPAGNRLCVSMKPRWKVDAVLLGDWSAVELRAAVASAHASMPWLRRIHASSGDIEALGQGVLTLLEGIEEADLHRIKSLAEYFIVFRSAHLLTTPLLREDFFTPNGLPHLFMDWRERRRQGYEKNQTPHASSWFNTCTELERRGIRPAPAIITAHVPYAQSKSNAKAAFVFFANAITAFSGNKFRTDKEMAFYCHAASLWAYAFKRAVPCDVTYWYVNTKRKDRRRLYANLLEQKAADRASLFLCLNDAPVKGCRPFWQRHLARFMDTYWPTPSPWE